MAKHDDVELEVKSSAAPTRVLRVSSASRVVFPATDITPAITKLELVKYTLAVSEPLLRVLLQRPTTLERWPHGVHPGMQLGRGADDGGFYQKRMIRAAPDYVDSVEITFPSGRTATELCPTEPAVLAWCAQMGTITFHPWPVRRTAEPSSVDKPDELRIDLDPEPGTTFRDVVRVALAARDLLGEFSMTGYCKTSGGRGVHVFVRIKPDWDFVEVRHAAVGNWSGAIRALPPSGGRNCAANESLSTTTRTVVTGRSPRRGRPGRVPGRRSPHRWSGMNLSRSPILAN